MADINDGNLGLRGFATEKCCFLGITPKKKLSRGIRKILGVPIAHSAVLDTEFAGIFLAGNSSGLLLPRIAEDYSIMEIEKAAGNIMFIDSEFTSLGNLILINDYGIVLSPFLKRHKKEIEKFFSLPCEITKIAGSNVVGTLAFATNKGCIISPKAKESEIKIIEKSLNVPANKGTVGFGSPFPGAGIIANSRGVVVSESTSGFEAGVIMESLGFV